jgi:MFS family permease
VPKLTRDARWTIAVLNVLYILSFADRQVIAMLVGPIKADLGLSDFQISLLMGLSFALLYAFVSLPMGYLADRVSRRVLVFVGATYWALSACACGFARTFPMLFGARAGVGIGEAVLPASANSLISDKVPPQRLAFSLSLFAMATSIGDAVSFALAGVVLSFPAHALHVPLFGTMRAWHLVFILTGLPGLLVAPLVFTFREPTRHAAHDGKPGAGSFLRWLGAHGRLTICFVGSYCVMGIVAYAASQWTPTYIRREFHWTPIQYGFALGVLFPAAAVCGHLVCGPLVDRMFRRGRTDASMVFLFRCVAMTAPFIVLSYIIPNVWVFLAGLLLTKSIMTTFLGHSMAALMAAVPAQLRSRAAAAYMLVLTLLGGALGPSLIAGITDFGFHDETKLGWSLAIIVALCATIALTALHFGRPALRDAIAETVAADGS